MTHVQDDLQPTDTTQPTRTRQGGSLWRNKAYMLLWSGQVVSAIGSQVSALAFPLLIFTLTGSPAQTGIMAALRIIPYLLFGLPAGALVDRWDRKRVMILCDTGRALALGSVPAALMLGHLTILQLYVVSFVEGTLFIFFGLAETACLPHVVSAELLPAATAQNEFIFSLSGLLGPSLSGILYTLGTMFPFLVDAVSYVVSVISLLFIRTDFQKKRTHETQRLHIEVAEGIHWLWRHEIIRFLALLLAVLNGSCIGYILVFIVLLQGFHASHIVLGLILACGGVGSIAGAFMAGPLIRRFRFGHLLIGATWIWALTWLFFIIAPNPFVLGVVTVLSFIIVPIHAAVQYTYRLTHIPDHLQGRVNSVFRMLLFTSQTLGYVVTGFLLQTAGVVATVLILFVPQLLLAIATTVYGKVRREGW